MNQAIERFLIVSSQFDISHMYYGRLLDHCFPLDIWFLCVRGVFMCIAQQHMTYPIQVSILCYFMLLLSSHSMFSF